MRTAALALLCVLVVAAGCSGLSGDRSDRATLTPAPVPSQPTEPASTPDGIAPGLSASALTDVEELARSHVAVARNSTYRWRSTYRDATWEDGALVGGTNETTVVVRNASHAYERSALRQSGEDFSSNANGPGEFTRSRWATPTAHFTMIEQGQREEPNYRRLAQGRDRWEYSTLSADAIVDHLRLNESDVYRVDVGERTHYLVNGTKDAVSPYGAVEDYRARAIVRDDGFVRNLTVSFNATFDGERHHVTYTSTYVELGSVDVPQPEWLPSAKERIEGEDA